MEFDSQLHVLRSCIETVPNGKKRHNLEHARFRLYSAIDANNPATALRWLEALRIGLMNAWDEQPSGSNQERAAAANRALAEIADGLKG